MDTHFEMKMHLKDMSTQERKEFLWNKGYGIQGTNDYLSFLFPKDKECISTE